MSLRVYNTLSGQKEEFQPLNEGRVGMYVCGPTVYSDAHLGNCRTYVSFDVIYRYFMHKGYTVRYVRNITDVGHLLDDGEDRMSKGARLQQLEPMEVAQKYTLGFHDLLRSLNTLAPNIEPRATGHIPEQIEMVEEIIKRGYGYEANGSVYFDVDRFNKENPGIYGSVSGRIIDDLLTETRVLKKQDDKRSPQDFAIWMKASEEHIMRWNSPWSVGFPGWHLECSAMSTKYLGKTFDIHGGGNDLKFPHHENEVAQNHGSCGCSPAKYWFHANMLLLNGKKMSKSDGNTISPNELFSGESSHVSKGYSPMMVRFFMLQAHYRSTLDMSDAGLLAAEKGFRKLMETAQILDVMPMETATAPNETEADLDIRRLEKEAYDGMDDDFNTAIAIAKLMEAGSYAHKLVNKQMDSSEISTTGLANLKKFYSDFIYDILGLKDDIGGGENGDDSLVSGLMNLILEIRKDARTNKDWGTSDKIRDTLNALEVVVKDGKEGSTWTRG